MSILKDILKACTYIIANAIIRKCDSGSNLTCTSFGGLSLGMGSNQPPNNGYYQQQPQQDYYQPQQDYVDYNNNYSRNEDYGTMYPNEVDQIRRIFMFAKTPQELKRNLRNAGYQYEVYNDQGKSKITIYRNGRSITIS